MSGAGSLHTDFPRLAATVLALVGGLAIVVGLLLLLVPLPRYVGLDLPGVYRNLLVVLALAGGGLHVLAGWWSWHRERLFGAAAATLVGMVLLQISVPLDVLVLGLLAYGREEFES